MYPPGEEPQDVGLAGGQAVRKDGGIGAPAGLGENDLVEVVAGVVDRDVCAELPAEGDLLRGAGGREDPRARVDGELYGGRSRAAGRGVDDWMHSCPWCGQDATGRELIRPALTRVRRLLIVSRIRPWGYRVLLRPGVSGVDPRWPKIVEIEQRYVTERSRGEIDWSMLVGLVAHELGHSFLYHNWRWTRSEPFRRAFGEVYKTYRGVDDTWVDFQRRRVATRLPYHVSSYAATHPQEDFAETFRFYVTRRGRMRELFAELGQKRKALVAYEKFLTLHDYVRSRR